MATDRGSADGDGAWPVQVTEPLGVGTHRYRARQSLDGVHFGAWSETFDVTRLPAPWDTSIDLGTEAAVFDPYADLYQDVAGTTPAGADGDPVALDADRSGNGHHFLQATDDKRPALKVSGIWRYLQFNGGNNLQSFAWAGGAASSTMILALRTADLLFIPFSGGASQYAFCCDGGGGSIAEGTGGLATHHVDDGPNLTDRTDFQTAVVDDAWHICEQRLADLSTWETINFGGYPTLGFFAFGGFRGRMIIAPSAKLTPSVLAYARGWVADGIPSG